jgi:hypothetical protein
VQDRVGDDAGSFALEGQHPRGHFVEHDAKRKKIGARVERLAEHLLGRHVSDRAHGCARTGELRRVDADRGHGSGFVAASLCRHDFREAEVQNLRVAALCDENIGRLNVAVDDAVGVGGVERVGDLDGEVEQRLEFELRARDEVLERLALEKFHGDEGLAVLLADIVNGADVRVVQR